MIYVGRYTVSTLGQAGAPEAAATVRVPLAGAVTYWVVVLVREDPLLFGTTGTGATVEEADTEGTPGVDSMTGETVRVALTWAIVLVVSSSYIKIVSTQKPHPMLRYNIP